MKKLLERAKNPDKLLEEVPTLLSPKILLSVLVTVNKWCEGRDQVGCRTFLY